MRFISFALLLGLVLGCASKVEYVETDGERQAATASGNQSDDATGKRGASGSGDAEPKAADQKGPYKVSISAPSADGEDPSPQSSFDVGDEIQVNWDFPGAASATLVITRAPDNTEVYNAAVTPLPSGNIVLPADVNAFGPGLYTATLEVVDADGQTETLTLVFQIRPTIVLTATKPGQATVGQDYQINVEVAAGGDAVEIFWNSATPDLVLANQPAGTSTQTLQPQSVGPTVITGFVTKNGVQSAPSTLAVTVKPQAPTVSQEGSSLTMKVKVGDNFETSLVADYGQLIAWTWEAQGAVSGKLNVRPKPEGTVLVKDLSSGSDFPMGSVDSNHMNSDKPLKPGLYDVILEAQDANANSVTLSLPFSVRPTLKIVAKDPTKKPRVGTAYTLVVTVPGGADRLPLYLNAAEEPFVTLTDLEPGDHEVDVTPAIVGKNTVHGQADTGGVLSESAQVELNTGAACNDPYDCAKKDVEHLCQGELKTGTMTVQIPKMKECPWGENENLSRQNGWIRARLEKYANVMTTGTICELTSMAVDQHIRYDDHLMVVLDDTVIASSFNGEANLPVNDGLYQYDWMAIRGLNGYHLSPFDPPNYCLTDDCELPRHDVAGDLRLSIPAGTMQKIVANGMTKGFVDHHQLKVVAFGDNDNGDCEVTPAGHQAGDTLNFTFEYKYAESE